MAEAEVTYIITDKKTHETDFEAVFAAVGAFQNTLPEHIVPLAYPSEDDRSNTATIAVVRTIADNLHYGQAQELAEQMKRGIESHFPEDRREELSRYFAGIAVRGDSLQRE